MMPAWVEPVSLDRALRLINHGPTVLVSAVDGPHRNVMAVAWATPLDFSPPKMAVVLEKSAWTRHLLEASGVFAVSVPAQFQVDMVQKIGTTSGREMLKTTGKDKISALDVEVWPAKAIQAPLIGGCVGWLECRLLPETHIQNTYDLFLGEVVAAHADSRVFSQGRWSFEGHDELRTLHHVAGGHFRVIGQAVQAGVP